ncbi:MAG: UTP--glucose-1-phosphate uridylyltransferase [Planctomycetota bacterium]|nr:UTP--glucose-1-phosphate uridylyltransferase [Planctomycetota bacterium]MDG2143012.1 UTP--glucose-1-phosphate uridylyltransferase [Planctomycetota bacterium]
MSPQTDSNSPDSLSNRASTQRARAEAADQGHVFRFWDDLSSASQRQLLEQLEAVDYGLLARLGGLLQDGHSDQGAAAKLSPPDLFPLVQEGELQQEAASARARGKSLLDGGKVAFMIVAGGQGSRLGYDGPKGCFPVAPLSERCLFDLHAARLRAAGRRHGIDPVWYVMTSPANDGATRSFFAEHDNFGLKADNVFFFSQEMLPALDLEGRMLLAQKDSLFLAPNGHGGSLAALAKSGALVDMERRGITTISFFQVDNPFARPGDALFLGLHDQAGAGMSSKVVAKRDAGEKVGVLGYVDGVMGCIEYSDLAPELREAKDDAGELLFRAGNIAVHAIDVQFVKGLTQGGVLDLPWHVARKNMGAIGPDGQGVMVDGAKFETFVFDALGKSKATVTLEADRALEFSPVKNKDGDDSADSCRRDLCRMFATWLEQAGVEAPSVEIGGYPAIEVDPLFAEDSVEFVTRIQAGHKGQPTAQGGLLFGDPE